MEFDILFTSTFAQLLKEVDELEQGQIDGVDGVDVLNHDQESQLAQPEGEQKDDTNKLVDLANLLLQSIRFKPSDEFVAYINSPRFRKLEPFKKVTTIRNVLSDHPERIMQEAEGDELPEEEPLPETPAEAPVPEFGDMEGVELDETTEMDILRLIVRSLNTDPYVLDHTLKKLPGIADENNYQEIIETIENALF